MHIRIISISEDQTDYRRIIYIQIKNKVKKEERNKKEKNLEKKKKEREKTLKLGMHAVCVAQPDQTTTTYAQRSQPKLHANGLQVGPLEIYWADFP